MSSSDDALAPPWSQFMGHLGSDGFADLDRRTQTLARQIRDNGVSYNVYADNSGPQRPWSLDLFPLLITPPNWQRIQTGVLQRVRLLDAILGDVYGAQSVFRSGLLPPALVQGHPGYLRAMHGTHSPQQTHLHVAAFDLSRGPDGLWWVVSQRLQAPSGLGYLLENRLSISRLFPQAFEAMQVQRLASTYQAWMEGLRRMSPAGANAHVALLTPGPYNETYFEHAYLARYLGISLVQGSDLTVRDQRLYLNTLRGLQPVHVLLKRVDDAWLDPLELRADSTLGVPGLLQAVRAGHVLMANAPGSAFLESPALLGFLPALSEKLLGEALQLPSLPTWWCGEAAAMQQALPRLGQSVLKPTYPGSDIHAHFEPLRGSALAQRERDEWTGRILREGGDHTLQSALPLAHLPTWQSGNPRQRMATRPYILRVFALSDGPRSWRVLPGGLTRLATDDQGMASMQRGGSSADTWVLSDGPVDRTTLLQPGAGLPVLPQAKRLVTSRAGSNLFWLGRYTERAENSLRLVRLALEALNGEDRFCAPMLQWLSVMAEQHSLLPAGTPTAVQARRVFERSLIASLCQPEHAASLGFNLRSITIAASAVRERLSHEQWSLTVRAEREFFDRAKEFVHAGEYSTVDALRVLEATSAHLAAMTGAQTDRMTRDDGWRLLAIGRQIERLGFLTSALTHGFETQSVHEIAGFEAMLALFDSTITFHAQYQQQREVPALLELLVLDRENPRSLSWVAQNLRGRLSKLAGAAPHEKDSLAQRVMDPDTWQLSDWWSQGQVLPAWSDFLQACSQCAWRLSEDVSLRYFSHTEEAGRSLGA
jgi:uncharacterized circularly permuted ATP-grasp superfamily protein/uncharacterized alpha-E superfamily protein